MSVKSPAKQSAQAKQSKQSTGLTKTLTTAFVILSVLSLLLGSSFQIYFTFQAQREVVSNQQRVTASGAANEVANFIEQNFKALETVAQVSVPSSDSVERQRQILERLFGLQPDFREVALLNEQGQEVARLSRLAVITPDDLTNRVDSDYFNGVTKEPRYISPIHVNEITNEPLMTLAVPIRSALGDFEGALVAEVNLRSMWDLVANLPISKAEAGAGVAYVVNKQGDLIAFKDTSRILRGDKVGHVHEVAEFMNGDGETDEAVIDIGINGTYILGIYVPLGTPDWAVIVELPVTEAYQDLIKNVGWSVLALVVVALLAGIGGVYAARRLAAPLLELTETATRIAEGGSELDAAVDGPAEIVQLAGAFNTMTARLRDLIALSEQRVADRTQRLEIVATLGERLSAILDVDQLLDELVNQVKIRFGYYHAQVYIIDDERQNLTMTAGAGEIGQKMKVEGHHIPLQASTSTLR